MAIESKSGPSGSVSLVVVVAENGYVVREGDGYSGHPCKQHVARNKQELVELLAELCGVVIDTLTVYED